MYDFNRQDMFIDYWMAQISSPGSDEYNVWTKGWAENEMFLEISRTDQKVSDLELIHL